MTLLSMNQITTYRWSLDQDIENYQEAGYSGIGVWRQKLSDGDEDRAIDQLVGSGLTVTHLGWAGGFTGSDGRTLAEGIVDALDAIRLAAAIQAGCLVIYSGGRNNHTFRHAGRLLRMALDELLPLAEACGVPLALEPMHASCGRDWTFLTDVAEVVGLIEEYQTGFLKIACDSYHFPPGNLQAEVLRHVAPHLGIVHLSGRRAAPTIDQERCRLGEGRLNLREMIGTLQAAGYTGSYDVKLMGAEIEDYDYWELLEQSQLSFGDLAPVAMQRSLA
jgi:sugar phosphate isomerase/epimerase